MAKKKSVVSKQTKFRYDVIRQYRANFNSSKRTAEVFGVSQRTIRRWMKAAVADQDPIQSEARVERYTKQLRKTVPLFVTGGEPAQIISERRGKEYHWQSYDIKRGMTLPENIYTRHIEGYQIIATDTYGHKITSSVGTIKAVRNEMQKKMEKYPKFHAVEVILQIRTDLRDVPGALSA